jgi:hypothetical protein
MTNQQPRRKRTSKKTAPLGPAGGILISIYHNTATDDRGTHLGFFGYEPNHPITLVYQYTTNNPGDTQVLAEEAYHLFNVGDDPTFGTPDERALDYRSRRNRSLTIGDTLHIKDTWLACGHHGWNTINPPIIHTPATPIYGTTPYEP